MGYESLQIKKKDLHFLVSKTLGETFMSLDKDE